MPPVVLLASTLHAARSFAARQMPPNSDDVLILAPSHTASRGWRRVLSSQNSSHSGAWLPRIATPEEYFLEAATFGMPDAPQWVTPRERRFLLRDLLPQLRRRLKHLSRLAHSSDLVRQLDSLIGDLRNSIFYTFDFGGDWSDDLRLIIGEYNRRLNEQNATDIECAPQLYASPDCQPPALACVVFDQVLAPAPAQWKAMQTLAARSASTLALVVVPWLGDEIIENWDAAARLVGGNAIERVLTLWREDGADLQVARVENLNKEYSDDESKSAQRVTAIRALLDHRRSPAPRHLTLTPCHTPRAETERIASHARARVAASNELENCVLALPDVTSYAPDLDTAFVSHGVPLRVLQSRPALSHPLIARLIKLFDLAHSEWTLDEISNLFGDGILRACHDCEVLDARRLRVACLESRLDSLFDLENCHARLEAARDFPGARLQHLELEKLARDLQCLSTLKARCDQLGGDLTALQWNQSARELLRETTSHLWEENSSDEFSIFLSLEVLETARAQVRCVEAAITRVENSAVRWIDASENPKRRGADFLDWLRLELESSEIENWDSSDESCGAALEVCAPLRLLCDVPPIVYFAGLVENAWPRSEAGSTLLARHRNDLVALRIHRGEPSAWAHYHIALCVREAEEVHLFHPQWQAGRESLRSSLLEDIAACWGELPPLENSALSTSRAQLFQLLGAWAQDGGLDSVAAQNVSPLDLSLENAVEESGASTPRLASLLELHRQRTNEDAIGIYDGALGEDGAKLLQSLRILNEQGEWSLDATRLKTYAQCPLRWFFRHVLKLEAPAELREEMRGNESGTLLHKILERFGIEFLPYNALEENTRAQAWFKLQKVAREEIEKSITRPILREAEARRLVGRSTHELGGVLRKWLHAEIAQAAGEMPKAPFAAPLLSASGGALPPALARAVEVSFDINLGGEQVRGRMDRIALSDVGETGDGEILAIFDYKTEMPDYLPRFSQANTGMDFQLPIYLLAARAGWRSASENSLTPIPSPKLCASFFTLRGSKWLGGIGETGTLGRNQTKKGAGAICHQHGVELPPEIFQAWLDAIVARLARIASLWRRAHFPLSINARAQAGCVFCDYQNICRRDDDLAAAREQSHHEQYSVAIAEGRGGLFLNHFYLPVPLIAQGKTKNGETEDRA